MKDIIEDMSDRLDAVNAKYIAQLEKMMEEMANAPRPEPYVRQPGERNSYEKYNLERARDRDLRMGTEVSKEL